MENTEVLTAGLFSASREVLTGTPLSDQEYAYLLTSAGRMRAKLVQQFWFASERARRVTGTATFKKPVRAQRTETTPEPVSRPVPRATPPARSELPGASSLSSMARR